MARGLAARDGPYLKILGEGGGKTKTKKQDALTEADKKVLDFRMQGTAASPSCVCFCIVGRSISFHATSTTAITTITTTSP